MELLLGITFFLPLGAWAAGGSHWEYTGFNGPSQWQRSFATCAGKRQSPINIETGSVKVEYWQPFTFKNYEVPAKTMRVVNNGHTAKVEMDGRYSPIVRHGGLKGDYVLAQLHFHWGSDSAQGSEHTIDHVRYPLEMHIVNYKLSYGGLRQSISKSDGLAVLGVMFEVGDTDNVAFTQVINALANITEAGILVELSNPYPLRAFLPDNTEKFYRYEGSLTTPTCDEIVIWTVFDTTVKISENQLNALRSLKTEDGQKLGNNYRPTQPLHRRKVYVSAVGSENSGSTKNINCENSGSIKNMNLAVYFLSTIAIIMISL